ncbi:MAG: T9SS type A sorting domain-containing protein [Ferruginibacter sp.]
MKKIFKNCCGRAFFKSIKTFPILIFLTFLSATAVANVYNVTSTTDGFALNQLRGAILDADALGGTHTINVAAGTYILTLGEIVFGNTAQVITIIGAGSSSTIISMTTGTGKDRIFFINPSGTTNSPVITVQGIKFENGYLTSDPYGGAAICAGGGSGESLTLTDCIFDNNILPSGAFGGAAVCMQVSGNLTVDNCTFTNNVSNDADGGAVYFTIFSGPGYTGDLLITNSAFTGNSVVLPGTGTSNGGALAFTGQEGIAGSFNVTINNNTFTNNTADGSGGAISAHNSPNLSTSQIHFNRFLNNTSTLSSATSALNFVNSDGSVNAENNWWGCNTGPITAGACDRGAGTGDPGSGSLDVNPWLQLKVTASPGAICSSAPSNTAVITAGFLNNSDGTAIPVVNLSRLTGLPVIWGPTSLGTLSDQQATIQANGTATATFTSNGTGGTATVNAQVDNVPAGEISPARASITVNGSSTPPTGATGITTICSGSNTTLTVSGGSKGSGAIAEWFTGVCGGTPAGSGDAITVSPTTTTTYYVRYNGPCNTTTCATVTVTVNTLSIAPTGVTGTTTICSGSSTTLTVNGGSKGTGASTQWFTGSCGGTPAGTGDAINVSPGSTTTYYVRYAGSCNTTSCASVTVTVNQLPTIGGAEVVQPTCAEPTGRITVNASGSGTLEYSIDGGANWFISNIFSGLAAGNYNIAVRSQSTPSCVSFYSGNPVILIAAANCCTPVNSGTVATGDQTICNGGDPSNITFSVSPSGGAVGGSFNYQWYYKDGVEEQCPSGTNTSGWTLISGATGNSYDPPSGLTTSRTYAVTVDPTGTPDCGIATWANNCRRVTVGSAIVATCSNNNPTLYFGYPGDQSATVSANATGGTAPYTISITMNRPLNCNVITSSGDELWTASGGTSINNTCPASGPGLLPPVSTGTGIASGVNYSVNVTLMQDAILTVTITDAAGCISTCTISIHAEDVRCFAGNSSNTKISICHQTGNPSNPCISMCVAESALASHLAHGDYVGNCTPDCAAPLTAIATPVEEKKAAIEEKSNPVEQKGAVIEKRRTAVEEKLLSPDMFEVKVLTNPTENQFSIQVISGNNEKVFVTVYDAMGTVVKQIEKSDLQLIVFGQELKIGYYMAVVRQGNKTKTVKLIKQ